MELRFVQKEAFAVLGRLGSTREGEGFIQRLWQEANDHFPEIEPFVRRAADGSFSGFWGLMSDEGMGFLPWEEDFTRGLYLAGAEVSPDAQPPEGWVKWTAPASEYAVAAAGPEAFRETLAALEARGLALCGAVYDFTDPKTGEGFQYFPIRRL